MACNRLFGLTGALGLILAGTTVLAHHGISSKFDPEQSVTLSGRVAHVDWSNPHAHIAMLVADDAGERTWYVELESPQLLEINGWADDTLQAGDLISVQGFPARDDSRQVWGDAVTLASSGQAVMSISIPDLVSTITPRTAPPTPRWPDGRPRLDAPAGSTGYWVPTTTVLMEDGAAVSMASNGQLENIADAAQVAPLQEWALRLYERRQREFLRSDPTYLECRPPAGPRKWLGPYGIQLLEEPALQRFFVISGGGNNDWHLIYTDGRSHDGDFGLDDGNQLYYGRNVGHWEGDTFVVESEGFNEKFWLPGGLPHSDLMKVTERLTRTDFDTLQLELAIDDPGTYTRPWKASITLRWLEGQDPPEHYCQDNRL